MPLPDESQYKLPPDWAPLVLPRRDGHQPAGDWYPTHRAVELALRGLRGCNVYTSGQARELLLQLQAGPTELSLRDAVEVGNLMIHHADVSAVNAWIDLICGEFGLVMALDAVEVMRREPPSHPDFAGRRNATLIRLREHLVGAPEAEYTLARVHAAARLAECDSLQRTALCFLFPDEHDWRDPEAISDRGSLPWILASLEDRYLIETILRLGPGFQLLLEGPTPHLLPTVLEQLGMRGGYLLANLKAPAPGPDLVTYARALACFPTKEAFQKLLVLSESLPAVSEALNEAARNFPLLAVRTLTQHSRRKHVLERVLRKHPEVMEAVDPILAAKLASYVTPQLPVAAQERWPRCLRDEFWEPEIPVIQLARSPNPTTFEWAYGEPDQDSAQVQWFFEEGRSRCDDPDEALRALLRSQDPEVEGLRDLIHQLELGALPSLLTFANRQLRLALPLFAPFANDELILLATDLYKEADSQPALEYLRRYPDQACRVLLPGALCGHNWFSDSRARIRAALRDLAQLGCVDILRNVARDFGKDAESAVECLLKVPPDQLRRLARSDAQLPNWLYPEEMPAPVLLEGGRIGPKGCERLARLLSLEPRPECLEEVFQTCTRDSLVHLVATLFDQWVEVGGPSKAAALLRSLTWVPSGPMLEWLKAPLRYWSSISLRNLLLPVLKVLADLDTPPALYRVLVCHHAAPAVTPISTLLLSAASRRRLTVDQLSEQVIPHFDLGPSGFLLDYGGRVFFLNLDENLGIILTDHQGEPLDKLPPPGDGDEPLLVAHADQRVRSLRLDLKEAVEILSTHFERAMARQRCWTTQEFQEVILDHPLISRLARTFVWELSDDQGLLRNFTVTENNDLLELEGEAWNLPTEGFVRLCHPLRILAAEREAWNAKGLHPPFPQLKRATSRADLAQLTFELSQRFMGMRLTNKLVGELTRRGWQWLVADSEGGLVKTWSAPYQAVVAARREEGAWYCTLVRLDTPTMLPHESLAQAEEIGLSELLWDLYVLGRAKTELFGGH